MTEEQKRLPEVDWLIGFLNGLESSGMSHDTIDTACGKVRELDGRILKQAEMLKDRDPGLVDALIQRIEQLEEMQKEWDGFKGRDPQELLDLWMTQGGVGEVPEIGPIEVERDGEGNIVGLVGDG